MVAPAEIKHLNKLSATPDSVSHGGGILRVILGFHKSGAGEGVEITKKHTPKAKLKSNLYPPKRGQNKLDFYCEYEFFL